MEMFHQPHIKTYQSQCGLLIDEGAWVFFSFLS